jgi:hypothetical protein
MSSQLLIECPDCESKVSAIVLAEKNYSPTDDYDPFTIHFLECPVCHRTMVGHSEPIQVGPDEWDVSQPDRLWPRPKRLLNWSIPSAVRKSIQEAEKCFGAQAYAACAVMCGRSLEALCKQHGAKNWQLARGLKELKDKGVIDGRLFEWGESLRDRRNIGAHATDEEISKEDAADVLDFTVAICEYVYVLAEKYAAFKKRESEFKAKKKT